MAQLINDAPGFPLSAMHTTWRRDSAIHEAGHAVAFWAIGVLPYSVSIPARCGEHLVDRRGRIRTVAGLCEASFSSGWSLPLRRLPMQFKSIAVKHAQLSAICDYAGPIAEARFRRISLLRVLITTGKEDFESVLKTLRWLTPRKDAHGHLELLFESSARRLLSEYATSVVALSKELLAEGRVECERIDEIIRGQAGHKIPHHGEPPPWLASKLHTWAEMRKW